MEDIWRWITGSQGTVSLKYIYIVHVVPVNKVYHENKAPQRLYHKQLNDFALLSVDCDELILQEQTSDAGHSQDLVWRMQR